MKAIKDYNNNNNENFNQELQELIQTVQESASDSSEYRKAVNKLFTKIFESKNLNKFSKYRYLDDFDNLYAEAKLRTYEYIRENINDYDPEKGKVMAWVNQTFYYKFCDVKNEQLRREQGEQKIRDELNNFLSAPTYEIEEDCGSYLRVVREDPEELLASIKLTYTNQKTNVKESISLRETLLMLKEGKTRMDIHRELNIPRGSLYSFIDRNLLPVKDTDSEGERLRKQRIRDYFNRYSR